MYTHRCLTERKPTEREKHLSQDERLHTHCLHAESLPTPSRDSAYCSRGLCYAGTLQLASLPTPINAATHLHPCLSFTPFLSHPLQYYSGSQGTDRCISDMTWPFRRISSNESVRHSSLVFPIVDSTVGSQAWNMLSHTQGVKSDTDYDAR